MQSEHWKEQPLPSHSSNKNKYGRLTECFPPAPFVIVHLYDYFILDEFVFYNNLHSFIHPNFNPFIPVPGSQVARVYSSSSGYKAGPSWSIQRKPINFTLDSGPGRKLIFFSHQCYNEMMVKKWLYSRTCCIYLLFPSLNIYCGHCTYIYHMTSTYLM